MSGERSARSHGTFTLYYIPRLLATHVLIDWIKGASELYYFIDFIFNLIEAWSKQSSRMKNEIGNTMTLAIRLGWTWERPAGTFAILSPATINDFACCVSEFQLTPRWHGAANRKDKLSRSLTLSSLKCPSSSRVCFYFACYCTVALRVKTQVF